MKFKLALSVLLFVILPFFVAFRIYAEGTYSNIGTTTGADGSNDAINFSQGRVWTVDKYGKYIWLTERRDTSSHYWAWSNDVGATWTEGSEAYGFLTRGSVAYDSVNDVLHVIWVADASSDGIIYRRYSITRDGSNNISSIQRVNTNVNLQLDTSSSATLEQPVAIWLNDGSSDGILIAIWSKRGTNLNETRGSMRRLSMTDSDGTAGNWLALDGTGDTFSTDGPAVAADKIYSDTSGSNASGAIIRGGSGSHKDDLYVFVAEEDDASGDQVLGFRATWSSGSSNWSGGWSSLGAIGAMNTSSGYSLKYQLITKPVLDTTSDRLYIGWARWKDGTNGDTVSVAYLDSNDSVSSTIDVYSALSTHSYAPTLDIAYDATLDDLYISYIESTTNGDNGSINYKTYDGSTLSSATRFYTSPGGSAGEDGSADIPILFENRSSNNRLLFAFRVNGQLPPTAQDPHEIYWGYVALATATPAPTATPTPTPAPAAPSNNVPIRSNSPNCRPGWSHCVDSGPSFVGTNTWKNISGVSVFMPSSLTTDVSILVSKYNPFSISGVSLPWAQKINIVSDIFELKAVSSFNGFPINIGPANLILPFDEERLQGVSPYSLKFVYFDEVAKKWKVLSGNYFVTHDLKGIASISNFYKYMAVGYEADSWRSPSKLINPTISGAKPTFGLCRTYLRNYLLACKFI